MILSDVDMSLPVVFAGIFIVAYVVKMFVYDARKRGNRRPPTMWSLPLVGSIFFLPHPSVWKREFLRMTEKTGNVFAFYIGAQYVLHYAFCNV